MKRPCLAGLLAVAIGVVVAGCTTGSNTYLITQPPPNAPTQAPPSPVTQASPFIQSATVAAAGNSVTLPATNGYAPAFAFASGSLPAGVMVTGTVSNQAPSGVTPLARRRAEAATSFSSDLVVYLGLDFNMATSAAGSITLTTTIPTGVVPSGYNLWLALYDPTVTPTAWQYGVAGPAQITNDSVSFTIGGGYAFSASQQYWLAVYALPTNFATPTPAPAAMTVTPTTLSLSGTGAANAKTFSVTEPNYKGSFQVSSGNANVATVSPLSGLGPSATFTVTPVGGGTTTITVSDQNGQNATVNVGVTAGTVTVSGEPQ